MNSTSSFWVSKKGWITLAKVNWCGGFIERVKIGETVDDLCQPLMFTTTLPAKPDSSVFFPLCHLWLCDRKDEIVQNPEWTQPKLFPHGEPWGRRLVWPHLYIFPWFVEWSFIRVKSWRSRNLFFCSTIGTQLTPDISNLSGKSKKVRVIKGEFEANDQK